MKTSKLILTGLLITAIKFATAQYSENPPPSSNDGTIQPTGYFEISIGLGQPMSNFSSANGTGYGGYALPGYNVGLSYGVPIAHSNFGVAVMYNYSWNNYDIDTYVSNVQYSDQNNGYTPISDESYRESFILAGLFATIPLQRLSFDFRVLGGVAICALPEVDYQEDATSIAASQNFEWDTYHSTSSSFASDIGAGLRFRIRRTAIMAGIDYLSADPMVNTTQRYTDQFGNSSYTHIGGSAPISVLSYSFGIGYQFR